MKRSRATKKIETILTRVCAAEIACGNRNYHRGMDKRTRLGQVVGSVRTEAPPAFGRCPDTCPWPVAWRPDKAEGSRLRV